MILIHDISVIDQIDKSFEHIIYALNCAVFIGNYQ